MLKICTLSLLLSIALLSAATAAGNSPVAKSLPEKKKETTSNTISSTSAKPAQSSAKSESSNSASAASPQSGERIDWDVLSSGGGNNDSSANFILAGTLGQNAVGEMTSTNFILNGGFWQSFSVAPSFLCGDADASGQVNVADAVYVINYIFASGPAPQPLLSFDNDCSGTVNVADIVFLINYIFASGPTPCSACK